MYENQLKVIPSFAILSIYDFFADFMTVSGVNLAGTPGSQWVQIAFNTLVANRVRENTKVFHALEDFLGEYDIPLLTHLRESQNYIRAAETGLGLFELAPSQVAQDVVQWDPVIEWLQRG